MKKIKNRVSDNKKLQMKLIQKVIDSIFLLPSKELLEFYYKLEKELKKRGDL